MEGIFLFLRVTTFSSLHQRPRSQPSQSLSPGAFFPTRVGQPPQMTRFVDSLSNRSRNIKRMKMNFQTIFQGLKQINKFLITKVIEMSFRFSLVVSAQSRVNLWTYLTQRDLLLHAQDYLPFLHFPSPSCSFLQSSRTEPLVDLLLLVSLSMFSSTSLRF